MIQREGKIHQNIEAPTREHLEQRNATLSSLLASMTDGIALMDSDDRLAYWNPQVAKLLGQGFELSLGMSREAFIEQLAARTLDPEGVQVELERAAKGLEGVQRHEVELVHPHPCVLQLVFFLIHGPEGQDWGCGLTVRDVTEHKEAEDIKAQLLATVAHELRTPLASIKGFATTLLREDIEWDEESRREFLQIINEESDRLTILVDEILDTSRLVLGKYPLDLAKVQLQPLVDDIINQAKTRTEQYRFVLNIPTQLPNARADPYRIKQVLHNLVDNALKYSPEGSKITIEIRTTDHELLTSVSDTGRGIPTEEQTLIFELFYRGETSKSGKQMGLGLGLPICRSIIEAHGGRIWVDSMVGEGSTFFFTLPVAKPAVLESKG
jgi:PAS domain S-box-containing protein